MLKGKKGSLPDVIFFGLKTLVAAVLFVMIGFMMLQFGDKLEGSAIGGTVTGNKSIEYFQTVGTDSLPSYFTLLFAFDIIGVIATSFLITLSPIFIILYIIFIAFAIGLSVFSMVFYNKFSEVSALSSYIQDQTMINWIMQYAPYIALFVGAISAIIIMSKIPGKTPGADI